MNSINIKKPIILTVMSVLCVCTFIRCSAINSSEFLGSAVIETPSAQIASTAGGSVVAILANEGSRVKSGDVLALIDTVPLTLAMQEAAAGQAELSATIASAKAQIAAGEEDSKGAEREFKRIGELVDKGSAPLQQRDNLSTQYQSALLRLSAAKQALAGLLARERGITIKLENLRNQLNKCTIRAPFNGVVLTRYKNTGEVAMPGNPFFEIGRYDTMQIDFFIVQPQLGSIKLGQMVKVRIDQDDRKNKAVYIDAVITWISDDAEFSPKNIQTRQSRNEMVFKVRAMAANKDGFLKRGLPVEVWKYK